MHLSNQEKVVYEYIKNHPGCTTHDITINIFVQKPCARIVGLESKGVKVTRNGQVKYPGTRPFERLYIDTPLFKKVSHVEIVDGRAVESFVTVLV